MAQNVSATVTTGNSPIAVAVNPITNKIYIVNEDSASVTVIDGASNLTQTIPVGKGPIGIAVNTVTNKIYVTNQNDNTVSVIDGTKETVVATPGVGGTPVFVAVNPLTNRIYISNLGKDSVSVIDGGTDTLIATVTGLNSATLGALAVNLATDKIYAVTVPNTGFSSVAVIEGSSNAIVAIVPIGITTAQAFNSAIAINPVSNKIYVANGDGTVSVIDGTGDSVVATVIAGIMPSGFAVNPVTNKIYVTGAPPNGSSSDFVRVIDGGNDTAIAAVPTGTPTLAATVDVVTNQVYAIAAGNNPQSVTVINGNTNAATALPVGNMPASVAVNPITNKIYVANEGVGGSSGGGNTVTVIDGAANGATAVTTGNSPQSVAVNPVTGQAFVTNGADDTVAVIQGAANATTLVGVGAKPEAVTVNPVTSQAYVVNQGDGSDPGTLTVIDGNSLSVAATVPAGVSPLGVVVNLVTNRIYVANSGSNNVMVVDGGSNTVVATIPVGMDPIAMAVNPVTNQIYVCNTTDGTITVIDGATNNTTTISLGPPPTVVASVAVNPVTNFIYVSYLVVENGQSGVFLGVIDGSTNTLSVSISLGADTLPSAQLVVNPITNMVYIANSPSTGSLVVLNASEDNIIVREVNIGQAPLGMALNPATNKIYVTDTASSNITVIDGTSNAAFTIPVGGPTGVVAVNPVTGKIYAGHVVRDISIVTEQQVTPGPLAVQQISPTSFTGVSTGDRNPLFEFGASGNPLLPAANVFYQVDTWQGMWQAATGLGSNFSGQLSGLALGNHILYAYAADGQDSTLYLGNSVTSPVAAYPFTVVQAGTSTELSPSGNPANFGQSVTLTAVVTSANTGVPAPTGNLTFMDGSIVLGTGTLDNTGTAAFATSSLSTGSHDITAVYGGDVNFLGSTSSALLEIDNGAATTTAIATSGSASAFGAIVTLTATVASSTGTPIGLVTFLDGGNSLGTAALNGSGQATLTTASLSVGTHNITAAYAGSANFSASTSAAVSQSVTQAGSSTVVSSSANPATEGLPVTFTAIVSSATSGVPTGSVTFLDGSSTLGATSLNAAGIATFTTAGLSAGSHSIAASYGGDPNLTASSSAALAQMVDNPDQTSPVQIGLSFTQSSQTVNAGNSATYKFTVNAISTLSAPVSFGCIGLPQGAACSFSPQTVNPGSSGTQTVLTVSTTAQSSAALHNSSGPHRLAANPALSALVLGAPILSLLALRRERTRERTRERRRKNRYAVLLQIAPVAGLLFVFLMLPGCGGTSSPTTSGSLATPTGTFTLGVAATSGSAQTITVVTLVVQ